MSEVVDLLAEVAAEEVEEAGDCLLYMRLTKNILFDIFVFQQKEFDNIWSKYKREGVK